MIVPTRTMVEPLERKSARDEILDWFFRAIALLEVRYYKARSNEEMEQVEIALEMLTNLSRSQQLSERVLFPDARGIMNRFISALMRPRDSVK